MYEFDLLTINLHHQPYMIDILSFFPDLKEEEVTPGNLCHLYTSSFFRHLVRDAWQLHIVFAKSGV